MGQEYQGYVVEEMKPDLSAFKDGVDFQYQMAQALTIAAKLKSDKNSKLDSMFDLGLAIRSADMTAEDAAAVFAFSRQDMGRLIAIMEHFGYDKDKYSEFIRDNKINTLSRLYAIVTGEKSTRNRGPKVSASRNAIYDFIRTAKASGDMEMFDELRRIRDAIMRVVPPRGEVMDKNYFKYSECVCCGAEPEGEGHELTAHKEHLYVKMPVCKECTDMGAQPDYEKVALLYAGYSLITEEAYYRIA
jgi:hypothetical protein